MTLYKFFNENNQNIEFIYDEENALIRKIENQGQKEVKLSNMQNKIFLKLISNAGRTVTFEAIQDFSDCTNCINMVNKLNTKLKKVGADNFINNTRETGYLFSGNVTIKQTVNEFIKDQNEIDEDFGNRLSEGAKQIFENVSDEVGTIEPELLPACRVDNTESPTIYNRIRQDLHNNNLNNYYIQSTSGSGKTSSLVYTCKKLMKDNNIIPIFIRARDINADLSKPISVFLYRSIAPIMDFAVTIDNIVEIFLGSLGQYLNDYEKKMVLIIDGCNESSQDCLKDLSNFVQLPNTMIIVSSRSKLNNAELNNFRKISVCELSENKVIKYLNDKEITLNNNFDSKNLRLPIYLKMFAQMAVNNNNINVDSRAEIIDLWIKSKENILEKPEEKFILNTYLPLLSMVIYRNRNYEKHKEMTIGEEEFIKNVQQVTELLSNEAIKLYLTARQSYNTNFLSEKDSIDYINILKESAINKLGFLQYLDDDKYLGWTHETYRDWFIAKGYYLIRKLSKKTFDEYFEDFIKNKFVYGEYSNRQDYPTLSIAIYLAELLKDNILVNDTNILFEIFLRNIAFILEDLGDYENFFPYLEIIQDRHNNANVITLPLEKCRTQSGLAYSITHIYNINERENSEQLIEIAKKMLDEAKGETENLITISYSLPAQEIDTMNIRPEELEKLFYARDNWNITLGSKNIIESDNDWTKSLTIENTVLSKDELNEIYSDMDVVENIDKNRKSILFLVAKIYGNFGSYYLNRFFAENNRDYLIEAHKNHLIGAAYKYILTKISMNSNNNNFNKTYAVSMRSLGIDMYHDKNYDLSITYFEYGLEHFDASEDVRLQTKAYIIRSKVEQMINENIQIDYDKNLKYIIKEESELITNFVNRRLFGDIERMINIIGNTITLLKMNNIDELNDIKSLINQLKDFYREYFMTNNKCTELEAYLSEKEVREWNEFYE
ncbi:helix-turn-helix domain-containing protein [uncultured Eubacterium sp.]|uniref:helix-turn-helix domain-containing protein n=1 Tax=uncultured Eubacterium sp. TaxID=165185 RepID=UPI0025932466|nr:helix-turn-helix domain-containing protein [uncultured Eubacterium sp.]